MTIIHVAYEQTLTAADVQRIKVLHKIQQAHGHTVEVLYPRNTLILMKKVWDTRPDVLHFHGHIPNVPVPSFVFSGIKRIWTVQDLPSPKKLNFFNVITTPRRDVQYQLLKRYNQQAVYIPDGYTPVKKEKTSLTTWGLRSGQYCLTMADHLDDIQWIASAYNQVNTRKKLIVLSSRKRDELHQLLVTFPFLQIIETSFAETYHSLIQQAAIIISTNAEQGEQELLQAMHSGKTIIAVHDYYHTELLGRAALYVQSKDVLTLRAMLSQLVTNPTEQKAWGKKAQKRAWTYFHINMINKHYIKHYTSSSSEKISVDSLIKDRQALEADQAVIL